MDSGDEQDVPNSQSRKKRYHRHTPRQIQELESYALFSSISFSLYVCVLSGHCVVLFYGLGVFVASLSDEVSVSLLLRLFKVCPHPDEKQRLQLSRDLGLEPRQINVIDAEKKLDFGASQTKKGPSLHRLIDSGAWQGQQERSDNCLLRAENDKIRCENIAMREALKNVICPSCGSPPPDDDSYFDEQKLRMDNTRLKEEVIPSSLSLWRFTGDDQFSLVQLSLFSHLDPSICLMQLLIVLDRVSSLASKYLGRPLTQLPPVQPVSISSLDLSAGGYGDTGISPSLDLDLLCRNSSSAFPFQFPSTVSEHEKPLMVEMATTAMEEVIRLVQTNEPLWVKSSDGRDILQLETYNRMFQRPGRQLKFPGTRIEASRDSALVIMGAMTLIDMFMDAMYEEIQVLSPVVPMREFYFLRSCQQIEPGMWVVADVSVDYPRDNQLALSSQSRRLASGYLMEEMSNGYTKVMEIWFLCLHSVHSLLVSLP
ncbi:hypothetical protein B296_00049919 [Ensete ventricosum]|uniref:START domain-containing protein n=1 Tax=Ensete ventricosum TaxID=4639 RepID=A0A426YNQ6_ENSVE|nr:hypothetical protein B296_00049919 [Ensete ventricosum]